MWRVLDRLIGGGAVILDPAPVKTLVGANFIMHEIITGQCLGHVDHRWQLFDVGDNLFRCIARLRFGLGDYSGIGITHMTDFAVGKHRALGFFHRLAITAVDQPARRVAPYLDKVFTGKHRQNARHLCGGTCVDGFDHAIGDSRAYKDCSRCSKCVDISGVVSFPSQKAHVLAARCAGSNSTIFWHLNSSLSKQRFPPREPASGYL